MSKSKLISLFVVVFYLIAFVFLSGRNHGPKEVLLGVVVLVIYMLLPLGCIWFSDGLGPFWGRGRIPEHASDWGGFVSFMGWLLLLLPMLRFLFGK